MAIEKALFTTRDDFATPVGIAPFVVNPYLYFNGVDIPTGEPLQPDATWGNAIAWKGATANRQTIDGPLKKAQALNGASMNWQNFGMVASPRHFMSMWIKPTAQDVTDLGTSHNFAIVATWRGDGWSNRGIHFALDNGRPAVRTFDSAGTQSELMADGSDPLLPLFRFNADQWYHVAIVYDWESTVRKLAILIDGEVVASTSSIIRNLNYVWKNSFTLGDMLSSAGASQYPFRGSVDEFIYQYDSVWTDDQIREYIDWVTYARYQDIEIGAGDDASLILAKSFFTGEYNMDKWTWTSPVIDLGKDAFGDFGRAQVNFEKPSGTFIETYTRTSKDQQNWNDWIKISNDGMINSPDERYMEIKVEYWTTIGTETPKIMEIQVLDYPAKKRLTLTSEPLIIYRDLDTGKERVGELVNAYDIFIIEEIIDAEGGQETIEFKMATNDPMRKRLGDEPVELIAQIGDKEFILRSALDKRDDSGKKYTEFFGESKWYELIDAKVINFEQVEKGAKEMMQAILDNTIEPTGWTIYKVETDGRKRTIRGEWKSVIELMTEVADQYGGELKYDTVDQTISLVEKVGEDNGVRFYYNKNLKSIERSVDTFGMITRLYLYGKNGMTIKSVEPDGLEYVQNLDWVNALNLRKKIRIDRWSDSRYTIPQNLMEDGQKMVDELGKPNVAYAMTVHDLSMLSGHEHESIGLGDRIHVIDTELLNLLVSARIVRRKYNVRQPWKTEVELNQPKKTLADANKRNIDDAIEVLAESDPIDTSDVQQMTVFNHLLNSRAEDGMTYWEVTGTGITPVIGGFSGDASWEIDSGYGETNTMKQSIYGVSHRSAYTISAYVGNSGTITRGTSQDAFVGIRVRIHYTEPDTDGNTYEDHYLAIPDITQEEGAI